MATHSSLLAWRIPWTEEPGGLQSMGSQRVSHDWAAERAHTLELSAKPRLSLRLPEPLQHMSECQRPNVIKKETQLTKCTHSKHLLYAGTYCMPAPTACKLSMFANSFRPQRR